MVHNPAITQTKLSENFTFHYHYVGTVPYHKQGVLLYNPRTLRTIARRGFQQINNKDNDIPQLSLLISNDIQTMPNISSSNNQQIQSSPDNID